MGYGGGGGETGRNLKGLYKECTTSVQLGNIQMDQILVEIGLKQGCVLSRLLFALYISELSENLQESGMGDLIIEAIFLADDMVIMAETQGELQRLLDIVSNFNVDRDLIFNARKSKLVTNIEGRKDWWELRGETVETGQAYTIALDEEEEYKYLGVTLKLSGGAFKTAWDNKIKKSERLANAMYNDSRVFVNTTLMGAVG